MGSNWTLYPDDIMVSLKARLEFERYCAGGDPEMAIRVIVELHLQHIEYILSQRPELAREDTGGVFCTEIEDYDLAVMDMMVAPNAGGGRATILVTRVESQKSVEKFMYLLKNMPAGGEEKSDEILH